MRCNVVLHSNIFKKQPIEEKISYIVQCKQNYLSGIYPAGKGSKDKAGYELLVKIAKSYFDKNLYNDFASYFMEGQYLIQLWTAHLILEYGHPNEQLKNKCIDEIKKYADSSLLPEVSEQERRWLETYKNSNIK
jgi:hypothetical protein